MSETLLPRSVEDWSASIASLTTPGLYDEMVRLGAEVSSLDPVISIQQAIDLLWDIDKAAGIDTRLREDVGAVIRAAETVPLDCWGEAYRRRSAWYQAGAEGTDPGPHTVETRKQFSTPVGAESEPSNANGGAGSGENQSGPYPTRSVKRKVSGTAATVPDDAATVADAGTVVSPGIRLPKRARHFRVSGLEPHPLLERMTTLAALSEKLRERAKTAGKARGEMREAADEADAARAAFRASVAERGVLEPLLGVPGGNGTVLIVDGRHRLEAAIAAGLETVPVILRPAEEARDIIADAVLARRHFTKSGLAYLAVLTHPEVATEAKRGNPKFSNSLQNRELQEKGQETQDALAKRHGVSLPLIEQACELYRLGLANPEIVDDAEMSLWAGSGLGGVLAGVKSLLAGGGTKNQSTEQKRAMAAWTYLDKARGQWAAAWDRWDALDAEHKRLALKRVADSVATAPAEVRNLLREVCQ